MRRALGLNLFAFALLFGLHVVFAANDLSTMFAIVACLISLQTVAFGPITAVLASHDSDEARRRTLLRSAPFSLVLALGLAWAYGDMAWSTTAVVAVAGLSFIAHAAAYRRWAT